jgi:biotin carboxylase
MTRPLLVVGYVGAALNSPALFHGHPVIFVEEPDVVRKREARARIDAKDGCDLVEWEFHLPGKADEFFHTHRDLDPAAIIPLTEYATPFAARLAERWGLPGAGYGAAVILRDKQLLRQVTRSAGIANPESVQVKSPADVVAFMIAHPGPVVLKPANRQASVGTQVIRGLDEIENAWANGVTQDEGVFVPDRAMELRMLAEQFVDGHEYSVEMLVRQGEPLFFNVTGKQLFPGSRPVELAHIVPADIPPELTELLGEQTRRVVEAAGFQDGIVHCEWIVSDGVPHVVECAGRFAGDGIIELIQRAYPVELELSYYLVLKGEEPKPLPREAKGGAAVRFLSIPNGVVEDVRGVEEAATSEGVFMCDVSVAKGDRFDGLRSSWDRVGDLMVTGDSAADALRLAEAAVAKIQVDVVPAELATTTS